jgi:hypothetical protein
MGATDINWSVRTGVANENDGDPKRRLKPPIGTAVIEFSTSSHKAMQISCFLVLWSIKTQTFSLAHNFA